MGVFWGAMRKFSSSNCRRKIVCADHFVRFTRLKQNHEEKFQNLLKEVIQASPVVETAIVEEEPSGSGAGAGTEAESKTFASMEELESTDPVAARCASEITGVEILKAKSGKIYLLSDKARIIPKHTLVGGYGTGKTIGCI